MIDWDRIATPSIETFLQAQEDDDNLWWQIGCGHHQNLFEDAVERIQQTLKLHEQHCFTCGVDNCQTRRILTTQYGENI